MIGTELADGVKHRVRLRDRYNILFGDDATTLMQSTWQHDAHVVAQFTKKCLDAHGGSGPQSQASDQH